VLERIIREGFIPDGATIAVVGNETLIKVGDEVLCYRLAEDEKRKLVKRTKIEDIMFSRLLVHYAVATSRAAAPATFSWFDVPQQDEILAAFLRNAS